MGGRSCVVLYNRKVFYRKLGDFYRVIFKIECDTLFFLTLSYIEQNSLQSQAMGNGGKDVRKNVWSCLYETAERGKKEMSLFLKECRQIGKTGIFYLYLIILLISSFFVYLKMIDLSTLKEPQDLPVADTVMLDNGSEASGGVYEHPYGSYAHVPLEDNNISMQYGYRNLFLAYYKNEYKTTTFGMEREVRLSKKKQEKIKEILHQMAGERFTIEVKTLPLADGTNEVDIRQFNNYVFDLSLEQYKKLLIRAGKIIGGYNSYLQPENYILTVDASYEQAYQLYDQKILVELVQEERVTGSFARLFADVIGLILGFIPAFVAVLYFLKDKNSYEICESESACVWKHYGIKYLSLCAMMFLPVLALSIIAPFHAKAYIQPVLDAEVNYFAYLRISVYWLLPTVMIVTAFSMLITYFTQNIAAIVVQFFLWILCMQPHIGDYSLNHYYIRYFKELNANIANEFSKDIFGNRLFYSITALAMVILLCFCYQMKLRERLGRHGFGKRFKNKL